jgi:hypothetical protein
MKNAYEIATLSAEIERDETTYRTKIQTERRILNDTANPGFAAAWERVRLLSEKQALAERIRRSKIMLGWARS